MTVSLLGLPLLLSLALQQLMIWLWETAPVDNSIKGKWQVHSGTGIIIEFPLPLPPKLLQLILRLLVFMGIYSGKSNELG